MERQCKAQKKVTHDLGDVCQISAVPVWCTRCLHTLQLIATPSNSCNSCNCMSHLEGDWSHWSADHHASFNCNYRGWAQTSDTCFLREMYPYIKISGPELVRADSNMDHRYILTMDVDSRGENIIANVNNNIHLTI